MIGNNPRFFRAVLRREPGMEFDPILASWTIERSTFDMIEYKHRLWKFEICRKDYVVFGIVTDLPGITEEDIRERKIWTIINQSGVSVKSGVSKIMVQFLEFKEWNYPKNYTMIDKNEKILDNTCISSAYDPRLLFSIQEDFKIRGSWNIIRIYRRKEEWNESLFRRIFNAEIQYGRKRWWT